MSLVICEADNHKIGVEIVFDDGCGTMYLADCPVCELEAEIANLKEQLANFEEAK